MEQITTLRIEFRYDRSSKERHFPKPIQAVLGHLSHEDCKGVIDVLKEESTREITVKVSTNGKNKKKTKMQGREQRNGRDETNWPRARHRERACSIQ